MASYSFKLPDLGEGTVESEIVAWRVNVGNSVTADQPLVDMMTDKATIEITAPVSGTLVSVAGEPGDDIKVGAELAVFATDAEGGDTSQPAPAARKPLTSPAIRRLARENDIDLNHVQRYGAERTDYRVLISTHYLTLADNSTVDIPIPESGGTRDIKLLGLRRKIAEQMTLSARRIPHFTYVEEVDVTELEQLRRHLNGTRQENQAELTYLPFFMQALVKVVNEFPQCNAHFDDERQVITQYEPVHVGIAVQTGDGLMVPVIRHAEDLDLWQCAHELRQIAAKARSGRARREDLTGSTITITSLGALGGIVSTPLINYPEVAIIGINRTQKRQVFENNGVTTRLVMNISSSFDHRIVDGHDAARAIQALKRYLEFPATLFLAES